MVDWRLACNWTVYRATPLINQGCIQNGSSRFKIRAVNDKMQSPFPSSSYRDTVESVWGSNCSKSRPYFPCNPEGNLFCSWLQFFSSVHKIIRRKISFIDREALHIIDPSYVSFCRLILELAHRLSFVFLQALRSIENPNICFFNKKIKTDKNHYLLIKYGLTCAQYW